MITNIQKIHALKSRKIMINKIQLKKKREPIIRGKFSYEF